MKNIRGFLNLLINLTNLLKLIKNLFLNTNKIMTRNDSSSSSSSTSSDDEIFRPPPKARLRRLLKRRFATKDVKKTYSFQPYKIIPISYNRSFDFPFPRSGHRIVCNDANIYLLGGFNPDVEEMNGLFLELWKYNIASRTWDLLVDKENENMPQELASNAILLYRNAIISHGGTGYPFGEICSNKTHIFGTKSPFLAQLDCTGNFPPPQYGPAMIVHNDHLYTIGGTTTGLDFFCDIYKLNLKTKEWSYVYNSRPEMRDDPEGRYRHELVYTGKYILILGGGTTHSAFDLKKLPAFNLELNCWEFFDTNPDITLRPELGYPKSRKCYSCVQYNVGGPDNSAIEVVVAGGMGNSSEYLGDIWKLHVNTMTWQLIRDKMNRSTYFHSAATSGNGCMYIFGGIEHKNQKLARTNDLYKIWTTIPRLSDMCWDALTYYDKNLDRFRKETLLKIGIPNEYVERIEDRTISMMNKSQ